jgi:hypothetical protein
MVLQLGFNWAPVKNNLLKKFSFRIMEFLLDLE